MRLYLLHESAIEASRQFASNRSIPDFEIAIGKENARYLHVVASHRNGGRKPKGKKPSRRNPLREEKMSYNRT